MQLNYGYHPAEIWFDWFDEEPEGGSNPRVSKKNKQPKASSHIVYTDTNQP